MMGDQTYYHEKQQIFSDNSHIFCCAQTGSGKTNFLERIACAKWSNKKKVIIFDRRAFEACQLGFPEMESGLLTIIESIHRELSRPYPHQVLVPFSRDKYSGEQGNSMHIQLPRHTKEFIEFQKKMKKEGRDYGWSTWEPYKIPFSSLRSNDLVALLRNATDSGIITVDFLFKSKEFRGVADLLKDLIHLSSRSGKYLGVHMSDGGKDDVMQETAEIGNISTFMSILRLLSNVEKSGIICNDDSEFALDLDAVMRDSERITTFTFANTEESFGLLLFVNILRQIITMRYQAKEKGKSYPQLVIVLPELRFYMPRNSADSPFAAGAFSAQSVVKDLLAQGRIIGITIIADTQTPQQIDSTGLQNFGWIIFGRNHKDAIRYIHENVYRVPAPIMDKVYTLETGRFGIVRVGSMNYDYPVFACPSLAYHRKERENVLEWIAKLNETVYGGEKFIEQVDYTDVLQESIKVRIAERPKKQEQVFGYTNSEIEIISYFSNLYPDVKSKKILYSVLKDLCDRRKIALNYNYTRSLLGRIAKIAPKSTPNSKKWFQLNVSLADLEGGAYSNGSVDE